MILGRNVDGSLGKLNLVVEFVLVQSRSLSIRHIQGYKKPGKDQGILQSGELAFLGCLLGNSAVTPAPPLMVNKALLVW